MKNCLFWGGENGILTASGENHRKAKLDIEKARHIRNSDKTEVELAKEFGVCQSLINRVKRGVSWGEGTVKGNIFSGLIASNTGWSQRA